MAKSKGKTLGGPEEWSESGFIRRFIEINRDSPEEAFAFVLGAGASVTSGIPAAAELAHKWVEELHERRVGDAAGLTLEEWATEETLSIPGFDLDDVATFYPQVYDLRFRDEPERGYAYLEEVMTGADPNVGYSILAQILANSQHRVVITTNFDNLVADALSIFTATFPLVCGHESLTGFVRPKLHRPLVAKVHRDLLLAPKSGETDTSELPESWSEVLKKLLKNYTPIFIGYGGNDGSLMGFLETLEKDDIAGRAYWCYRKADGAPNERIRALVSNMRGVLVGIIGFDELMLQLGERLDYPPLDSAIEKRAKARAERYREHVERFQKKIKGENREVKQAFDATFMKERNWWAWDLRARAEDDPAKREEIYRNGLKQFPESAELLSSFAIFLHDVRKQYDEAETLFKKAFELNPQNAAILMNFGTFLWKARKDYVRTEKFYREALELEPNRGRILGNLAVFLCDVRKEYDEAEKLYRRALELSPADAGNMGNSAVFLWNVRKDYAEAEKLFRRALEIQPEHTENIGNYANFLFQVRKDYDEAEKLYTKAIELDPEDATGLGNFGGFLVSRSRVSEALGYLKSAWQANQRQINQPAAEIAYYCCIAAQIENHSDDAGLARLKYLLKKGFKREHWSFDEVLAAAEDHLSADDMTFYRSLSNAILDESKVGELEEFDRWKAIKPVPVAEPWDM